MGSSWMLVLAGFGIILIVVLTTNMLAPQFAIAEVSSAPRRLLPTDSVLVTGGAGFVGGSAGAASARRFALLRSECSTVFPCWSAAEMVLSIW